MSEPSPKFLPEILKGGYPPDFFGLFHWANSQTIARKLNFSGPIYAIYMSNSRDVDVWNPVRNPCTCIYPAIYVKSAFLATAEILYGVRGRLVWDESETFSSFNRWSFGESRTKKGYWPIVWSWILIDHRSTSTSTTASSEDALALIFRSQVACV